MFSKEFAAWDYKFNSHIMKIQSLALPFMGLVTLATIAYSEMLTSEQPPPGPVHVSYWEKWTAFEGDAIRAVVEDYNHSQSKIHVDLLTVSNINNKTLLAVAGGDPPDVAGLEAATVAQYADDNALLPLDDFCKAGGISAEQYIPAYWNMGFYRGHVFALPTTPVSTALHYSKKMLRDAGLDDAKTPETIEELDSMAAKITTRDKQGHIDKAGFLPAEPGWWNWGWGYYFGGALWDGKSRITANSPENIRAFEWIASWSKKYGVGEIQTFKSGFGNFSSPQNAFLSGKVAMELQGVWMYNFIDQFAPQLEKPKLDWVAAPFPHPTDRPDLANTNFVDSDIVVIPNGAKHPNEAFEFIAYLQSQKAMEQLCLGQRKHSPLAQASAEFYSKHPNPYIKLFTQLAKSENRVPPPQIAIWPEYSSELSNAYSDVALLKKTPKEALDYVQNRMQPILDEYLERLKLRNAASK